MAKKYAQRQKQTTRFREQFNMRLESQLVERIHRLAARHNVSIALMISQLLEKAVAEAGEPWAPEVVD